MRFGHTGYLTKPEEISLIIEKLTFYSILWLDTEIANHKSYKRRLSLIQVLANPSDANQNTYILDVLDRSTLVDEFVNRIMTNPKIQKVFHSANFDLQYLGGKNRAKNVICTLKMAQKIPLDVLGTSDRKLKTLAIELCGFTGVDTEEQASNWERRPLTPKQLNYAKMDTVYLAAVHQRLLKIIDSNPIARKDSPELTSLSVTNVRVAFECPRLFYLSKRFGKKALFLPDRARGIGTLFHKLANDFIIFAKREPALESCFSLPANELKIETIVPQIRSLFYHQIFFPNYLQPALDRDPNRATALHYIWQGFNGLLKRCIELLIKNRRYCHADRLICSTFIVEEFEIKYDFIFLDGRQQPLSGKLDFLLYDFEQRRLCVVELKTYHSVDLSAQLAQVALYSYMVGQNRGLPANAAIYCILPEFKEYLYAWEQLENTVIKLIPHKLEQMQKWLNWETSKSDAPPPIINTDFCNICSQSQQCQKLFPTE